MTWLDTTYYLAKAEAAEKSDNPEIASLGENLKHALWAIIERDQALGQMRRLLDIAPDQPKMMKEKLKQFYGEPVMPVSEYCKAFDDWIAACQEAHKEYEDEIEGTGVGRGSPPPLWEVREYIWKLRALDIGKSSYLARRIYGGERHRTRKCPVHKGHWSGLPFDPPLCGCDLTGWLPEPPEEPETMTDKETP